MLAARGHTMYKLFIIRGNMIGFLFDSRILTEPQRNLGK